ncbi:hypothetical protein AGABI2DRAFT_187426 [Agaricus bisporus var. bisporus H97]|uniref:hypothetical protein n=1 Tax=Agaricus bisporus var. bisporus (strain H97 / ATCC MYA-4626 / FGSC 10389) TaxID=936046 RepID=UPI00029F7A13|nr:hypothetical protein AGABI2DRAFT_187426 [Agaricus bisporus var. bisporus H97]EKV44713.1 hypothetical protein AGABI2DRAFT_187426 [Agaricus bisporus var. bisporus H97]
MAHRLADEGLDVAINDLEVNRTSLQETQGIIFAKGHPVVESLGGLDVLRPHCSTLLANAGICFGKLILDTTVENWTGIFTANIRSMLSSYNMPHSR